jgi:hypothetical protein
MAVQLVVHAGLIAVERYMTALGLRWTNIVSSCWPPPNGLFFRIDDGDLVDGSHSFPPLVERRFFTIANLQENRAPVQAFASGF